MGHLCVAVAIAIGGARPAFAQSDAGTYSRYESLYGRPVEVSLSDLALNPESYARRAIHTRGRLDFAFTNRSARSYVLRDLAGGAALELVPVPELSGMLREFDGQIGREAEVTGVFEPYGLRASDREIGSLAFWEFTGAAPERKVDKDTPLFTLEQLVSQPGKQDGRTVRVVGQFRGGNLFGDLPVRSKLVSRDWVIKDDLYAVWVTGRKPKGAGFDLDGGLKRDTGKWLEVVGRVETRGQVTYLHADAVALSAPPKPDATVAAPPPPPARPKVPPVVVFSLPLDGETDIRPGEPFVVQFSKDMDVETFGGHVMLRYQGVVRPGDRPFDGVSVSYDLGRRALSVDPGDRIRPGRVIELVLMPGIKDIEGLELVSRPGKFYDEAVDVLRWTSATDVAMQ